MNKFLKEFKDRGFFYQCTNEEELSSLMDKKKIKAYIGFDCTAESLHVGASRWRCNKTPANNLYPMGRSEIGP